MFLSLTVYLVALSRAPTLKRAGDGVEELGITSLSIACMYGRFWASADVGTRDRSDRKSTRLNSSHESTSRMVLSLTVYLVALSRAPTLKCAGDGVEELGITSLTIACMY